MASQAYSSLVDAVVPMKITSEKFADNRSGLGEGLPLALFLALLVLIFVQVYVVFYLWNNVLIRVTTIARPMKSLWYALGLIVLVVLLKS
jgi:hypothetical protein